MTMEKVNQPSPIFRSKLNDLRFTQLDPVLDEITELALLIGKTSSAFILLAGPGYDEAGDEDADARHHHVGVRPIVRFFCGTPVRSKDGHTIGMLGLLDSRTVKLSQEQRRSLVFLSQRIARYFELKEEKNQEHV